MTWYILHQLVGDYMIYSRNIQPKLIKALSRSPVTLLTGARQTGKTTLIKSLGKERGYSYITFDDIRFLSAAKNDPIGFINGLVKPVILDEVQRVPEIFLAIKQHVDENRQPGLFALTGSANPLLLPQLGDSLAGRMEILELFPLSQGELQGITDTFVEWAFKEQTQLVPEKLSKDTLYHKIITGGYPLVQDLDADSKDAWFNSYTTALLQRDVQDLAHISGLSEFPHLLQLLATRTATLLNTAELARTSGLATTTLHRYLTLLKTLFLVDFQRPWSSHLGKRLVKSPKTYFVDTGLVSFLLSLDSDKALSNPQLMGPVLENFVQAEIIKQVSWSSVRIKPYHFRTQNGIEVDIVLENGSGQLVGIEIKNSETVTPKDFKGLTHLQETTQDKFVKGIVLYAGSEIIPFGAQLYAMPISSLWAAQ